MNKKNKKNGKSGSNKPLFKPMTKEEQMTLLGCISFLIIGVSLIFYTDRCQQAERDIIDQQRKEALEKIKNKTGKKTASAKEEEPSPEPIYIAGNEGLNLQEDIAQIKQAENNPTRQERMQELRYEIAVRQSKLNEKSDRLQQLAEAVVKLQEAIKKLQEGPTTLLEASMKFLQQESDKLKEAVQKLGEEYKIEEAALEKLKDELRQLEEQIEEEGKNEKRWQSDNRPTMEEIENQAKWGTELPRFYPNVWQDKPPKKPPRGRYAIPPPHDW